MREDTYSMYRGIPGTGFEDAVERVTDALRDEGFGVLTRIDVRETLKTKIGADFRPYLILGACNPELAHRALTRDDNIGVLLPCNVVVAATDHGAEVAIIRPHSMLDVTGDESIRGVADEAQARLERVIEAL